MLELCVLSNPRSLASQFNQSESCFSGVHVICLGLYGICCAEKVVKIGCNDLSIRGVNVDG